VVSGTAAFERQNPLAALVFSVLRLAHMTVSYGFGESRTVSKGSGGKSQPTSKPVRLHAAMGNAREACLGSGQISAKPADPFSMLASL
jgi:hypothetical protein